MLFTCQLRDYLLLIFILTGIIGAGLSGCGKDRVETVPPIVFQPVPGGISGPEISDNLVITVVDRTYGNPLSGARVFVHQGKSLTLVAEMETDENGVADFTGGNISGPVTVTAICQVNMAYDTLTLKNINASQIEMPLQLRKKNTKTKIAMQFEGLDTGDLMLAAFRNTIPLQPVNLDPESDEDSSGVRILKRTVYRQPLGLSALVYDQQKQPSGFGAIIRPSGPPPRSTPIRFPIHRITDKNLKKMTGSIELPENMDQPPDGWVTSSHVTMKVLASGGICGSVIAGLVEISDDLKYRADFIKIPDLESYILETVVRNGRSGNGQESIFYIRDGFDNLPVEMNIQCPPVPVGIFMERKHTDIYPVFRWDSAGGNLQKCTLFNSEYNYYWEIYDRGDPQNAVLTVPPLEPGSPGTLVPGEVYRFQVESMSVKDLDYNHWSFQSVESDLRYRSRSSPMKFKMMAVSPALPDASSGE